MPIERDLPMDMRTRDYVKVNGQVIPPPRARAGVGARALPGAMISVRVAHTAQLDPGTLADARALLDAVFDDMTDDGLGAHPGRRARPGLGGRPSWSATRRWSSGGCCTAGGRCARATSRASAVRADRRRRGHAAAMMRRSNG